jgi:zinc transport system ATP-binding protein
MQKAAIEIRDVWYSYGQEPAVHSASFTIAQGDFCGIIGPNGGGKTTLLRLILGVIKPDRGVVSLLGASPLVSRRLAGYVPQETATNKLFPITVMDVVLMGLMSQRGIGRHFTKADKQQVSELLLELKIDTLSRRSIGSLSGGQRQKVLLARALVARPSILFLDEPTASIDAGGQNEIYEYLKKCNADGTTVVLVTHNVSVVSQYVHSIICVNKEVHFHADGTLTPEAIEHTFGYPVDLLVHGMRHRNLHDHGEA